MTSSRWASLAVVLLLGCTPLVGLVSCGSDQSTTGGGDEGGAGDDGSADGTTPGDGAPGGDTGGGDGTVDQDAGGGGDGACVPTKGCPSTVTCGHYTDPCTGVTVTCGTPCPQGKVCTGTNGSQSCQTPSCAGKCGDVGVDSCGVPILCPGCPTGQACINNACVPQTTGSDAGSCSKLTCTPTTSTHLCGTVGDGCGNTMQCSCPTGQQCVGGVCQTTPLECDTDAGIKCGTVPNACGSGKVQCGGCAGTTTCQNGTCTPCTPPSCNGQTCGNVSNGCGPAVGCGTCTPPQTCDNGGCCTPSTCSLAAEAGIVTGCGPVDLGCGVKKDCSPCPGTDVCLSDGGCCAPSTCAEAQDAGLVNGCNPVDLGCGVKKICSPCPGTDVCHPDGTCTACQPKTCSDFGNTGCNHFDGCSQNLDCCSAGTVCRGGLCCQPGEVDFEGTCCKPQCDPTKPPGPQISCGEVLNCGQG